MTVIISFLTNVVDPRQAHKVVHSLPDIIMIVFFAHLAKYETWEEIYVLAIPKTVAYSPKFLPIFERLKSPEIIMV